MFLVGAHVLRPRLSTYVSKWKADMAMDELMISSAYTDPSPIAFAMPPQSVSLNLEILATLKNRLKEGSAAPIGSTPDSDVGAWVTNVVQDAIKSIEPPPSSPGPQSLPAQTSTSSPVTQSPQQAAAAHLAAAMRLLSASDPQTPTPASTQQPASLSEPPAQIPGSDQPAPRDDDDVEMGQAEREEDQTQEDETQDETQDQTLDQTQAQNQAQNQTFNEGDQNAEGNQVVGGKCPLIICIQPF